MNKQLISKKKILSVFDFDGTLTYYDSFVLFLYFAFNKRYFLTRLIRMILPTLYFICRKTTRDELKKKLIKHFLTGICEKWCRQQAEIFCKKYWKKLMRPKAISTVITEINSGAEVIICSASPMLILEPFAFKLGIKAIGTQLESKNEKLTGYIIGKNCRCAQKVERLKIIYGDIDTYYLRAWGDTKGDYELLAAAQESHWRSFI